MRSILILGIVGVAIVGFGKASRAPAQERAPAADNPPTTSSDDKLRDTLLALDKQYWEATSNYDVDTLAKLLSDDYIGFSPDGHHWTKKFALERYRQTRHINVQFPTGRFVIPLSEHTAILSYEVLWGAEDKGTGVRPYTGHDRMISFWVEREGCWSLRYSECVNRVNFPDRRGQESVAQSVSDTATAALSDKDALQGVWKVASVETNGKEEQLPWLKKVRKEEWVVKDRFITMASADPTGMLPPIPKLFVLRPDENPKEIDMNQYWVGLHLESDIEKGIYTLNGDVWKVCLPYTRMVPPPKEALQRPSEMATREGGSTMLITLKRQKSPPSPAEQEKAAAAKSEFEGLQGTWKLLSHEERGKLLPHDDTQFVTIARDQITWKRQGQVIEDGQIDLNADQTPKQLDFEFASGRSDEAIYFRKGDYLILCGRRNQTTRPSAFATGTANGGEYLVVLKREE
jgi:uncharacterized protein (TIGR03067 family)